MRVLRVVVALAVYLWAVGANGEIFKCVGRDGRVSYTDQTCPGSASATPMKIEPNVIDASADRALAEAQARPTVKLRNDRPSAPCEQAARGLEALKREADPDPKALNAAYEAVVAACVAPTDAASDPDRQPRAVPVPAASGEPPRN